MAQTDAEHVRGVIRLTFGGTEQRAFRLAVLKFGQADEWIGRLEGRLQEQVDDASAAEGPIVALARVSNHAALDMLLEYDRDGVLDRAWLVANATVDEVFEALEAVRKSALPFGPALTETVMLLAEAKAAALLGQPSSSNGHSTTGASARTTSPTSSRTRSSTSSGKRGRVASPVSPVTV